MTWRPSRSDLTVHGSTLNPQRRSPCPALCNFLPRSAIDSRGRVNVAIMNAKTVRGRRSPFPPSTPYLSLSAIDSAAGLHAIRLCDLSGCHVTRAVTLMHLHAHQCTTENQCSTKYDTYNSPTYMDYKSPPLPTSDQQTDHASAVLVPSCLPKERSR